MIFSVLGLLVLFSGQILALSTGGFSGISYSTFDTTVIDTSKFVIGRQATLADPNFAESRKCQVEQLENVLHMRGCPLNSISADGKILKYLQVEALKDFYGQDVRIEAYAQEGAGTFYIGDFSTGNFVSAGLSGGYPGSTGLLEVIPSELDPTQVEIAMNGQHRASLQLTQTEKLNLGFFSSTGFLGEPPQPGAFNIIKFKYEPQFGCDVRNGELLVTQTFTGGQNIDIYDFEFDPVRFCPNLPALIIDQKAQGTDTSYELLNLWKTGGSYFIPEHQNIEVRYVMRNSDGLGAPIIPIICTNATYDVATQQCKPKIATLVLCDGQLVDGDCITRVDTTLECVEEGATLREDGTCVKRIPSTQVMCEDGTIVQGTTGTECQARVDDCEIGYTRKELNGGRFECVSDTKPEQIFSNAGNEIAQTAVSTVATVTETITDERPDQKTAMKQLLAVLLVIIFVIGVVLYMWKRGKR